jgi:hypothetical protein
MGSIINTDDKALLREGIEGYIVVDINDWVNACNSRSLVMNKSDDKRFVYSSSQYILLVRFGCKS